MNATQVKNALEATEKAHHSYETDVLGGVRDVNWANWYASFLSVNYPELSHIKPNILEKALINSTASKEQEDNEMAWEEYTTQHLIDNFPIIYDGAADNG